MAKQFEDSGKSKLQAKKCMTKSFADLENTTVRLEYECNSKEVRNPYTASHRHLPSWTSESPALPNTNTSSLAAIFMPITQFDDLNPPGFMTNHKIITNPHQTWRKEVLQSYQSCQTAVNGGCQSCQSCQSCQNSLICCAHVCNHNINSSLIIWFLYI